MKLNAAAAGCTAHTWLAISPALVLALSDTCCCRFLRRLLIAACLIAVQSLNFKPANKRAKFELPQFVQNI